MFNQCTTFILNRELLKKKKSKDRSDYYDKYEAPPEYNIPEGKKLGVKLKEIEEKWVENNFEISKLEVQKIIKN